MRTMLGLTLSMLAAVGTAQLCAGQVIVQPGGATGTSLRVGTLTTGTLLDVTPTISADGRYATMRVRVTQSALQGIDTLAIPPALPPRGGVFLPQPAAMGAIILPPAYRTVRVPTSLAGADGRPLPLRIGESEDAPDGTPAEVELIVMLQVPPGVAFVEVDKTLLQRPVEELKGRMSLKAGASQLARAGKTNVVLSAAALKAAAIDPAREVAVDLPVGTLKEALTGLLAAAAGEHAMVVTAEDNVVLITTQAQADRMVTTKYYYLEDLIKNSPRWMPRETNLSRVGQGGTNPPARQGSTDVATLITQTVRPEIWKANGGKIGDIVTFGNRVAVTAPVTVHALLDGPRHYDPNRVPRYIDMKP